jgi:hypothetical protein
LPTLRGAEVGDHFFEGELCRSRSRRPIADRPPPSRAEQGIDTFAGVGASGYECPYCPILQEIITFKVSSARARISIISYKDKRSKSCKLF